MSEQKMRKIRNYTILGIIVACICIFVIYPYIQFKKNESVMKNAVKRYYEVNEAKLPTGRRVSTVTLDTLFKEKYIENDFYIPLTKKVCSTTKSWGKVTKKDEETKYYIYLDCGVLKSNIDHNGPKIKLKGKEEMTIGRYEDFKDPGVESVSDSRDGKLSVKDVEITGKVDTFENGTYKIKYTAYDNLRNKTTVTRTINVIQTLLDTVDLDTDNGYYKGEDPENYIYFSNNIYRILGTSGKNVKLVSEHDIGNVNYQSLDQYLEKYYESLSPGAKEFVVKNKYCNMKLDSKNTNTKSCNSYTKDIDTYLLSIDDVNKSMEKENSYLISTTAYWLANPIDDKKAFSTYNFMVNNPDGKAYAEASVNDILGIKPVVTLKGDTKIKSGIGTKDDPYYIGDTKTGSPGDELNTRYSGEYVSLDKEIYRIVSIEKDKTTKVIGTNVLEDDEEAVLRDNRSSKKSYIYDPKEKNNIAYYVNNKGSKYVSGSFFVSHQIEVPIYRKNAIYGKEIKTKKYKVKYFVPDAFDLYNTFHGTDIDIDYWLINSTEAEKTAYFVGDLGNIYKEDNHRANDKHAIRVCGYVDKTASIVSGEGTEDEPYVIAK